MGYIHTEQALKIAIESVEIRTDLPPKKKEYTLERLNNLLAKKRYIKWDKESIIKALFDFKDRTGKIPTVADLHEAGMPKTQTITLHLHATPKSVLRQLFPENNQSPCRNYKEIYKTKEDWINCFIQQFAKHKSEGMYCKTYNKLKDNDTPQWETIARNVGVARWGELLDLAGVLIIRKSPKRETPQKLHISNVSSPTIDKLSVLNQDREMLNNNLNNILNNNQNKT